MAPLDKVTIRDVAVRAGVSITTVSHVLNEVPGKRVSADTRKRIREVADEMLYRPNRLAQGLRTQRSHTLGFVSDDIATTPYAGRMILGAQEAAAEVGSLLLLLSSGGDPDLEDREVQALIDRQVDGVVFAAMYHRIVTPPQRLNEVPAVLLDARSDSVTWSSVVPDEVGGSRAAVEEMLMNGHRRIAFFNNVDDIPATRGRLIGYRQALEVYGVPFDPALVLTVADPIEVGPQPKPAPFSYEAALDMLASDNRPTGIFCFNDRVAMGVYQAASHLRLSVPEDLSVVGFDDQEVITFNLRPGLTTVKLPHYDMGRWAVETLLESIRSDGSSRPVQAIMPCPLVRRASVTSPPRR